MPFAVNVMLNLSIDSCNFVSVKLITDVSDKMLKKIKEQNCMNYPNCMQIRFSRSYAAFLINSGITEKQWYYVVEMTVEVMM